MSIQGIASSSSVAATYTLPSPQQSQQPAAPKKAATTDTVTISPQAQKLATDGDTQAKEVRESGAEKSSETSRGKA